MKLNPEAAISDNRRKMVQLLTADIKQVNYWKAVSGSILGNHYHKDTTEYFYILCGEATLEITGEPPTKLRIDDFVMISPNKVHTLKCHTDLEFLTFLSKPFNPEHQDLWRA
jgi:quercetin dioxygenase-like cupin family protein